MDEKKLGNLVYRVSRWPKLLCIFLFLLGATFSPMMWRDGYKHLFLISIISGLACLLVAIKLNAIKIIIQKDSIMKMSKYPHRSYRIKFNEIAMISDDDISTWPFTLHIYHLIPKDKIKMNFCYLDIGNSIENWRELLSEIVSRVGKDTQIDESILHIVGEYKNKPSP